MLSYQLPPALDREIDELETLVAQHLDGEISAGELKARRVPFGIYEQRHDGSYMVRVRCAAGVATPTQLREVAVLAARHGSGKLHLTTRQEIQIHDLPLAAVIPVIRGLRKVGLASRGGGGNTVRNIMASHDSGIAPDEVFDVAPYAVALTTRLMAEGDSWTLPRKYKITFASSPKDNANARFNDLGFVAKTENGVNGFEVYVAGGMGTKPEVAHLLHEFIRAEDAYAVARAVKEVFSKHGNRRNRHAARLRFLWRRLGREGFVELYNQERAALEAAGGAGLAPASTESAESIALDSPPSVNSPGFEQWHTRHVSQQKQPGLFAVSLPVFLGMVDCERLIALCDYLQTLGDDVIRLTMRQNIHLRNIPQARLPEVYVKALAFSDLSAQPAFFGNMIACTGADTCRLGICRPRGLARAIRRELAQSEVDLDALGDLRFNVSGCPNSCGQHPCADLGLYGKAARHEGTLYPAYNVVAGAVTSGLHARMGKKMGDVPARRVPAFVAAVADLWRERKRTGGVLAEHLDAGGGEELAALSKNHRVVSKDRMFFTDWGATEAFSLEGKGPGECSAGVFDLIELDLSAAREMRDRLRETENDAPAAELRADMVTAASRALLITKGVEARSPRQACQAFAARFVSAGLVDASYGPVVEAAAARETDRLAAMAAKAEELVDEVSRLYEGMDNSLLFPAERAQAQTRSPTPEKPGQETERRDFRGVACPMNFVKTKLALAGLKPGQLLEILLDDGAPIDNVPRSVRGEGHEVVEQKKVDDHWSVLIKRKA
jgi:sulfite reductase (ferredoxin)